MKKIIFFLPIIAILVMGCSFSKQIIPITPLAITTAPIDVTTTSLVATTTNDEIMATSTVNVASSVSICDLADNPAIFIDKQVKIKATLRARGNNLADPEYYLEDSNCQILVSPWTPQSVATCPPSVKICNMPKTMPYYTNKLLIIDGALKELPKSEYISNKWTVTGTYFIFTTSKLGVSIVQ